MIMIICEKNVFYSSNVDNVVSKGARNALSLSSDDSQLACCGPSEYNVTIYSSSTLLEVCLDYHGWISLSQFFAVCL